VGIKVPRLLENLPMNHIAPKASKIYTAISIVRLKPPDDRDKGSSGHPFGGPRTLLGPSSGSLEDVWSLGCFEEVNGVLSRMLNLAVSATSFNGELKLSKGVGESYISEEYWYD